MESICHVVDWHVDASDASQSRRHGNARATWDRMERTDLYWSTRLFLLGEHAKRTSVGIGDKDRLLPFVRDVIDFATASSGADIIVFTNCDICLSPEAPNAIRTAMWERDCCYGRRVDVLCSDNPPRMIDLYGQEHYFGVDLFAFRRSFWTDQSGPLPDMLLGCEGWDMVYLDFVKHHGGREISPAIYHERHQAFWHRRETWGNAGREHNRRLHEKWRVVSHG